jgi:glycosyltransferase involved in cell wall biosynthesis
MGIDGDNMKKKILVRAPALSQSGYGESARFALRSLRSREDLFDIYLINIRWGETGWIWEDDEERKWLDSIIKKTVMYIEEHKKQNIPPQFDISLQDTIPQEWEKLAPVNIGYTAGTETTKMSPQWIEKSLLMDKILVISNHTKYAFENSTYEALNQQTGEVHKYFKCTTPIEVVHYPVRQFEPDPDFQLDLKHDFNFLCSAQWSPRKNIENTIRWWLEEFWDQEVGLILKGNIKNNSITDRTYCQERITALLSEFKDRKCSVHLLHGDLTNKELSALYQHPKVKGFINLAHGEGFGLPVFEAAYYGLPVIAPNWGGVVDFLYAPKKDKKGKEKNKAHFLKVDYDIQQIQPGAVWDPVLIKDSQWAFPKQGSYKMALRKLFKNYSVYKNQAANLQKHVTKEFEEQEKYKKFVSCIHHDELENISIEDIPKISLITSVFKAEEHIEQLMENITSQSIFKEKCEWIFLDANPEDLSPEEEIIKKYAKKYPDNIIYKKLKKDPGVYGTWNKAIKMSTGEYITNINCDDRRAPWALEKQAKTLVANSDVDLVYNDSYIVHEPNKTWGDIKPETQKYNFEQFSKEAMLRGNLPHNNPMWRKDLHEKNGYFNAKYKSAGDWDFWLKCSFEGSKFKKIDEPLGIYYFNPKGVSTNKETEASKKKEEFEVFKKYQKVFLENK